MKAVQKWGVLAVLIMLCAVAAIGFWFWQRDVVTTQAVVVYHQDQILWTAAQDEELTTLHLDGVTLKDQDGKKISAQQLEVGDWVEIRHQDYRLLSYPAQYTKVYWVKKTGTSDPALAEEIYRQYQDSVGF